MLITSLVIYSEKSNEIGGTWNFNRYRGSELSCRSLRQGGDSLGPYWRRSRLRRVLQSVLFLVRPAQAALLRVARPD